MSKAKKTKINKKNSKASSSTSSILYIAAWLFAAFGAIYYISTIVNSSAMLTANKTSGKNNTEISSSPLSTSLEKTMSKIQSGITETNDQLKQLNNKYFALEGKLSKIRRNISSLDQNNDILSTKIDLIEEGIGPITGSLGKNKQPNQKILAKNAKILKITKKPITKVVEKKMAALNVPIPILRIKQPKPVNLNKPQIMRTMFAVALGTYPDLKRLKTAWSQLNKKYKSALGDLKPRYLTLVVNNKPQYQLVSGPLINALDAAKICYHLQQSKSYCKQTVYMGSNI